MDFFSTNLFERLGTKGGSDDFGGIHEAQENLNNSARVWTAQNDQKKSKDEPVQLVLLLAKIAGVSFNAKLSKLLESRVNGESKNATLKRTLLQLFVDKEVKRLLVKLATIDPFSQDIHAKLAQDPDLLRTVKRLKYWYNLPMSQFVFLLFDLWFAVISDEFVPNNDKMVWKDWATMIMKADFTTPCRFLEDNNTTAYNDFKELMIKEHPHSIFPTNIYRSCDGCCISTADSSTIECVMSTTLTTTIKITNGVLDSANPTLYRIYGPLKRCVAVVDKRVDTIFGDQIDAYFNFHGIQLTKLAYRGNEVDKEIANVEKMLVDLKNCGISRNEPVLIVGGGVVADIAGFACALYHRSTPYVMLCTSVVSGIDAGPSPRTCCDGFGFKNLYGAYHPPILTITDRNLFKSLRVGWIRHGIAEIIKMAVVKDIELFELLEEVGPRLVHTKFGTEQAADSIFNVENDEAFQSKCDLIVSKALDAYVRSEYGNLWETHQCRPHAYGHTWSPGYELAAGMLHGHAVATGMGFGAYLSFYQGWISAAELRRILRLISNMELSLWHPIMSQTDLIWNAQVKMTQKRGGHLCAPLPKNTIGECGYLDELTREDLDERLDEYRRLLQAEAVEEEEKVEFPRSGLGVEVHCVDVGLEDPSVVANVHLKEEGVESSTSELKSSTIPDAVKASSSYAEWIASVQTTRNKDWAFNVTMEEGDEEEKPPKFDETTLFKSGVEDYAMKMTSLPSASVRSIASSTMESQLFAPCMVGTLESQFLKMQVQLMRARRCLDVGTFTGMSALAMAEGGAEVITLENEETCAAVASACFKASPYASKIKLILDSAEEAMKKLLRDGEKFDIVFLDADKENYICYYELAMSGLLAPGGVIMADNSLCALVYDEEDERRQRLHDFNRRVKADQRVEQVVLTIREGISIIRPIENQ